MCVYTYTYSRTCRYVRVRPCKFTHIITNKSIYDAIKKEINTSCIYFVSLFRTRMRSTLVSWGKTPIFCTCPSRSTMHIIVTLKGHGNEADFLGFLQNSVRHRFLTLNFEPFRFWLRIRGDIRNRKTTPRLAESGSRQECL